MSSLFHSALVEYNDAFKLIGTVLSLVVLGFLSFRPSLHCNGLPVVHTGSCLPFLSYKKKLRFFQRGRELLQEGFAKSPTGFRIDTHHGLMTVLSSSFANEVKDGDRLGSREWLQDELLSHLPVLSPLTGGPMTQASVNKSLLNVTRALGPLTSPISEEASLYLTDHWTDRTDWHEVHLSEGLMRLVVRVSARAFLGPKFSRDERWINASVGYTFSAVASVYTLHLFPAFLHRPLVWVLPLCRQARAHLHEARRLLQPELDRRKAMSFRTDDAITWMEEANAGSSYDPVAAQLWLSFVASDTTADFITKFLVHLAENQAIIAELREEIVREIGAGGGLSRETISRLKLLDSAMKESQRLSPTASASMARTVRKNITLTNGTELSAGSKLAVSTASMRDPKHYSHPDRFDGHRFLDMEASSGEAANCRFVSTSESHMGFGHGIHACPGRFFAAHELKILLCHILTKYDFKLADGYHIPPPTSMGFFIFNDPDVRMLVRRRKEELDL